MRKPLSIYLAGPISGCTFEECTAWRNDLTSRFAALGVECYSPMRAKDYLSALPVIQGSYPELGPLATARGIMTRDSWDCHRADVVVFNLLNAPRVSVGTVMELAWAWKAHIPTVVIMESGNCHEHPMVDEATSYRVGTVEEAYNILRAVLNR